MDMKEPRLKSNSLMLDAILANSGLTYCAMVLALVFFLSFFFTLESQTSLVK